MKTYPILDRILEEVEPLIIQAIEAAKAEAKEKERPFTERDEKWVRIMMVSDLVKALGAFIVESDQLQSLKRAETSGNSIVINCNIKREGTVHNFTTEIIYAGGYNIQRLHLRYLVKTTLERTALNKALNLLKAERARMSKEDRIIKEIDYINHLIKRDSEELAKLESMSDEEVINSKSWLGRDRTWDKLNEGGKVIFESEEKFNQYMAAERVGEIESHKRSIIYKKNNIKGHYKNLQKNQQKLLVITDLNSIA